ncbi:hypothetical protein [Paenibacillus koleovorans]|uniref:hypothetical protein n=1 Tax=Paenibacillus koleovorans TaxID=121608 RepID=UPI000FDC27E6|nr:hypothetical protein [Paenibacillus koleovorans]
MAHVTLRPDLKTSGGEVCDILLKGRYAGTMALVIREGHRVAGSVQLEEEAFSAAELEEANRFIRTYIDQTAAAVGADRCEVIVTCSSILHILSSSNEAETMEEFAGYEDEEELLGLDDEELGYAEDAAELLPTRSASGRSVGPVERGGGLRLRDPRFYELVIVGESRNRVEYHIYDQDEEWIAEVLLHIRGNDLTGEIHWLFEPLEDEIEQVLELILSDFDENEIDTISIDMLHEGELFETFDLTHEDLISEWDQMVVEEADEMVAEGSTDFVQADEADGMDEGDGTGEADDETLLAAADAELDALQREAAEEEDSGWSGGAGRYVGRDDVWRSGSSGSRSVYSILLARDDVDALTYEIYEDRNGGIPVGSATVDISQRELTGFIEFKDRSSLDDREEIGVLLMQELDKERDYDSVHFTMLLNNRPVDEIMFETEQYH